MIQVAFENGSRERKGSRSKRASKMPKNGKKKFFALFFLFRNRICAGTCRSHEKIDLGSTVTEVGSYEVKIGEKKLVDFRSL